MAYNYEEQKEILFTDQGQRDFLAIRDEVNRLLDEAGAFSEPEGLRNIPSDSWFRMACIDRMVELGEIRQVNKDSHVRVFVRKR